MVRGTGIRVQTIEIAARLWHLSAAEIAAEYELMTSQVEEALAFHEAHRREMDCTIEAEAELEPAA